MKKRIATTRILERFLGEKVVTNVGLPVCEKSFQRRLPTVNVWYDDERLLVREQEKGRWYLALERNFMGSCSSCWSWGCWRMPNLHVNSPLNDPFGSPADLLSELNNQNNGTMLLCEALEKVNLRIKTGLPQSAGKFIVANIDLYGTYGKGYIVSDRSLKRLEFFRKYCSNSYLNQPGYGIVMMKDDSAIAIVEDHKNLTSDDDNYLKFLPETLAELHYLVGGISVAIARGEIFYLDKDMVVGEPINKNWLNLRAVPNGTVVLDESAKDVEEYFTSIMSRRSKKINLSNCKIASREWRDGKEFTVKDKGEKPL